MHIITKLALIRITTKKARSTVICAAILLTMVLFMTIASITANLFSGYSLMLRLASGTDFHGYLRGAAFSLSGESLRDAAQTCPDITDVAISSNAARYALHKDELQASDDYIRTVECEEDLGRFYTDLIDGTFPTQDNEILVNMLHFPNTKVGDTVGLYYISHAGGRPADAYAEFIVSGIIKGRTDEQMQAVLRYSDALAEMYGFSDQYLNVYVRFNNHRNLTERMDRLTNETLAEFKLPDYEVYGILNQAYLQSSVHEVLNPASVCLILFSTAVVFLCSFLLIYNVYSIALTQDMKAVGLLNVIGTTHKQIRRIIVLQSMILLTLTLPIGLLAGYGIAWKLLSPLLFSALSEEGLQFTFSAWIPLSAIVLTAATLLWSAVQPLNRLKDLTPIAAVAYSPAADLPSRYVRHKNYHQKHVTPNAHRMAAYTISRNRKKTCITALSMSVSVILFVLISTLCEYMVVYTESNLQHTDYILHLNHTYHLQNSDTQTTMICAADGGVGIHPAYGELVCTSDYADEAHVIRTAMTTVATPDKARTALGILRNTYPRFDASLPLKQALSGQIDLLVVSIPDNLFGMMQITEHERLGTGNSFGYAVYDGAKTAGITDADGYPIDFTYFEDGQSITLDSGTYTIRTSDTISPTASITGWVYTVQHRAVLYLSEQAFVKEFGEGQIYAILVDAKEDCYDLLRSDLERMSDGFSVITDDTIAAQYAASLTQSGTAAIETLSFFVGIDGRMDHFDQMKQTLLSIQTVGYSLSAMIFLIGALNIVNTALSSVSERKLEFAMLEAIGMTDRQLMHMLLTESIFSSTISVLITVCIGFPLILLIIRTAMHALVSLHWVSAVIMMTVCMAVSVFSALLLFKLTKSSSLSDRIQTE